MDCLWRIFSFGSPPADFLSRISSNESSQSDLLRLIFSIRSPLADFLSRISFDGPSKPDLLWQIFLVGSPLADLWRIFSVGSLPKDFLSRIFSVKSSPTDLLRRSSIQSHQLHRGTPQVSHCRLHWIRLSTPL